MTYGGVALLRKFPRLVPSGIRWVSAHLPPFLRILHGLISGTTAAHIRLQPGVELVKKGTQGAISRGPPSRTSRYQVLSSPCTLLLVFLKPHPRRPHSRRPQSRRERYTWIFYLTSETRHRTALALRLICKSPLLNGWDRDPIHLNAPMGYVDFGKDAHQVTSALRLRRC